MAKQVKETVTRISAKQKFEAYKTAALQYIRTLRNPATQSFFSVVGYEKVDGKLKPSTISAPELLAIVGTAKRLGKNIQINTFGADNGGRLDFIFVDEPADIPQNLIF
jgi:hypothetical protein